LKGRKPNYDSNHSTPTLGFVYAKLQGFEDWADHT